MKKITKLLMVMLCFVMTSTMYGQTITGIVNAEDGPLPGANIVVKGTTNGTTTDFDGKFSLKVTEGSGVIEVSFIGYSSKELSYTITAGETKDLGIIILTSDNTLEEIVVRGVIDIAKDRQTPVASSTIRAIEIQEKLGSQEFPEILKSTPSVYATKSGGGFGDARITIRGFQQENIAVLINGVPVNDMENGRIFWSNWAGLSDVTSAMQVQRGLGSSKLAISSVGGTINVITRTSEQREGGSVAASFGNDNYQKYKASYSTGKMDNGLSASLLFSRTEGDGYVDGTAFLGHNYFIGIGYEFNDNNSLEFTFTGAPQWHHQRSFAESLSTYQKFGTDKEPSNKYNSSWGYLNGEEFNFRRNFYHKPVMSLNYDLRLSESSSISTILYASWGRGGGSGPIGDLDNIRDFDSRLKDENGLIRFDDIVTWNSGGSGHGFPVPDRTGDLVNDRRNGLTRRASVNSHNWYGVIANFHNDANENLSWDLGIDLRTYKGIHYRVVSDLLGASGYTDDRDDNNPNRNITAFVDPTPEWNPWANITNQQKIEYYNEGNVRWLGAFGQIEYSNDVVSAFLQGGISQQGFQRIDFFNLPPAEQESDFENILGGNIKGGLNWNINESHNIFFNGGFYSKQPFFNSVYTSFSDNSINPFLTNEKIVGLEFGYGFTHENYNIKLNVFRTSWKDRFLRGGGSVRGNFIQINGAEQLHTGVELETQARFGNLTINLASSVGNYEYKGNAIGTEYDEDNDLVAADVPFFLDGVKVGDAPEITANLGFTYKISEALKFDITQFYNGNLYPRISASSFTTPEDNALGSIKLPGNSLIDAGISYKLKLNNDKMKVNFRLNVNNLANQLYISDAFTNTHVSGSTTSTFKGVDTRNRVYFGYGRTWNASVRFNF